MPFKGINAILTELLHFYFPFCSTVLIDQKYGKFKFLESNVVAYTSYTASESINAFEAGVIWAAGVKSPNAFKDASYDTYSFITIKSDDTTYRRQRGIVINCCEPDSIVVTNALLLIIIIVTVNNAFPGLSQSSEQLKLCRG